MLIMNKEIAVTDRQIVLSIIIVNYNVKEYILNCIQSIQDKIDANRCPYEVIVSDNGSVDGSVEAIRERFPWVKVIENNANLGFGKANNIGAKQAKGEVLFFLNPDTLIVKGIEEMVEYILIHKEVGSLNPLMLDERNSLVVYGIRSYASIVNQLLSLLPFYVRLFMKIKRYVQVKYVNSGINFKVSTVSGFALMLRQTVFNKVNGFDEKLFLYEEDVDIGFTLQKKGYRTLVFTKAYVIHYGSRSSLHVPSAELIKIQTEALKTELKKQFYYSWWLRYILESVLLIKAIIDNYLKYLFYFARRRKNVNNIVQAKIATQRVKQLYRNLFI